MFGYVLPGLREVRGPLVVGAMWGWTVWLWIGPSLLTDPMIRDLFMRYGLDALPDAVWLSVLVLLAYTGGSLLMIRTTPFRWVESVLVKAEYVIQRLNDPTRPKRLLPRILWAVWQSPPSALRRLVNRLGNDPVPAAIDSHLRAEHAKYVTQGRFPITNNFGPGCFDHEIGLRGSFPSSDVEASLAAQGDEWDLREGLIQAFIQQVKKDEPAVEVRIQMRFPDVHNEIDRLRAEGQLRISIFWPGVLAAGSQAWLWSGWWLVAVIPLLGLLVDGKRRLQSASDKTWSCLIAGEVSSPLLDEVRSANELDPKSARELEGIF